jgi:hypothetical protein
MAQIDPVIVTVKRPLNFRDPLFILIIVCLIFFILWQRSQSKIQQLERSQDNKLHQQRIEAKDTEIRTLAGQILTLTQKSGIRRADDSLALKRKETAIATLSHKLAEKRHPIQVMADTIQPLRDYLILSDSLLAAKDTLIHEMTLRHSAQVVELDRIIDLQTQQIMAESVKTKLWEEVAVKTEKDYNKERRKKGFFKVTTAVAVGLCLFLAVK